MQRTRRPTIRGWNYALCELKTAWNELTAPGAPFEIIRIPVLGQELRAYKNAPPTIRHFWLSTAAYGERTYLVYGDERITYAEAHARVAAIANWILDAGVKPGDRVAIAMRNYPEWMLIYWACACIGVAAVGMNAWWTAPEMAYGLTDAAPKVVFADAERIARMEEQPGMLDGATLVGVRAPNLPEVPTVAESIPGYEFYSWYGLWAPAKTSPEITQKLNQEVNKALAEMKDKLVQQGIVLTPGSIDDFARFQASDMARSQKIITEGNIRVE